MVLGQVANHFDKQRTGFLCHSFYQNKFKMYFKIPGKIQINLYVILEWEFFLIHISIYAHMYMYTHTYMYKKHNYTFVHEQKPKQNAWKNSHQTSQ